MKMNIPKGLCFALHQGFIQLRQNGIDNFEVRYGKQVNSKLCYAEACSALGSAIMHSLACDGLIDNREKGEKE